MICAKCREEIHRADRIAPNDDTAGWYHIKTWVEFTADHKAEPVSEVIL